MSNIRTARGNFVNFEMLAIKAQLAANPIPKSVQERRLAIEEKEGIKPLPEVALPEVSQEVNEMLAVSKRAAETSKEAPKRK